jgi:hypothetical protein
MKMNGAQRSGNRLHLIGSEVSTLTLVNVTVLPRRQCFRPRPPRAVLAIWRSHRSRQRGVFRFIRRRFREGRSSTAISTDDDAIHVRWIAGGTAKFDAVRPRHASLPKPLCSMAKEAALQH